MKQHPEAAVLVHPESPQNIIALAGVVGSTTQLIKAAHELPNPTLIVATDNGILYKMRQAAPGKRFFEAPTVGAGATCVSCAHCPWMAMNTLRNLAEVLETGSNENPGGPKLFACRHCVRRNACSISRASAAPGKRSTPTDGPAPPQARRRSADPSAD